MQKPSHENVPLDPEVKKAGLRILERAFGEVGAKGGDTNDLKLAVDREILRLKLELEGHTEVVRNIGRLLAADFFRFVSDETKTPVGKKYNQIIEKFAQESTEKYIKEKKDIS